MGVSGSGKTTVGRLLATRLSLPFYDADDFHPEENLAKMARGCPLNDDDRRPWLEQLAGHLARWQQGRGALLACSALKERYRTLLSDGGSKQLIFICLHGDLELIQRRMRNRAGHFFPLSLLQSQFSDLELTAEIILQEIDREPAQICAEIIEKLRNFKSKKSRG